MRGTLDLWSYDDVLANAEAIAPPVEPGLCRAMARDPSCPDPRLSEQWLNEGAEEQRPAQMITRERMPPPEGSTGTTAATRCGSCRAKSGPLSPAR
jgi:hypothetical protein